MHPSAQDGSQLFIRVPKFVDGELITEYEPFQAPLRPRVKADTSRSRARGVKEEMEAVTKRISGKYLPELEGGDPTQDIALATVLPHLHTARYVAGWSNTATSVASPYVITTVDFTETPGASAELGGGCFFAAISRDPLCAIIEYVPNPNALQMQYAAHFATYTDPAEQTPVIDTHMRLDVAQGILHPLPVVRWDDSNTGDPTKVHPHGQTMYTRMNAQDSIHKYTYMTKGELITIYFEDQANAGIIMTAALGVLRSNGDSYTEIPGAAAVSQFINYVAPESGYYTFYTIWTAPPPPGTSLVQVTLRLSANMIGAVHSHLGHRPLPGIEDRNVLSGIRINGAALMITPDSAELAKGGRISGVQFDSTFLVESVVKNSGGGIPNNLVDNVTESVGMDFHKGGYAFHKPRTASAYQKAAPFRHNVDYIPRAVYGSSNPDDTVSSYHCDMISPDGWLAYAVTTPPAVAGGVGSVPFPGGIAHITYSFSVEYWHYDVWIGKQMPPTGVERFNAVMELISGAPQFHENALHLSDLKRWYNNVIPTVKDISPALLDMIAALFPQYAPVTSVIKRAGTLLPQRLR
jgi:hypothetical protein